MRQAFLLTLLLGLLSFAAPPPSPQDAGTPTAPPPASTDAGVASPPAKAGRARKLNAAERSRQKVAEGDALFAEKRYRDASFAYQDAVNADAANLEALFKLGNAYAVLGYYTQAIDRWSRVAQGSPDPAVRKSAQENITQAQAKMTSQADAGTGPEPHATRSPDAAARAQARVAYEEGVRHIQQRDYGAALPSLTRALQLDPTLSVAYTARGSANIGLRRYAEAARDYEYALRLQPEAASPLYGLAEAYRGLGRTAEARSLYQRYVAPTATDVRPELVQDSRDKAERLR